MPNWTNLPDNIVAGDAGHITYHNGAADNFTILRNSMVDWINVVTAYGADPTGNTDSTSAIQNAINAAASTKAPASLSNHYLGMTVYFPWGDYLITSPLTIPRSGVRLTGPGNGDTPGARIITTASGAFANSFTYMGGGVEIDHLTFDITGGHIFSAMNLDGGGSFHDLFLIQRSTGYSVWDHNGAAFSGGDCYGVRFQDINVFLYGNPRSVPAWNFYNLTSESVSGNTWENIYTNNVNGDNTQYVWSVSSVSTSTSQQSHLVWRDCQFSTCCGGSVYLNGVCASLLENCNNDNFGAGNPAVQSAYSVTSPGGSNTQYSRGITFLKCSRETVNITGGGSTWFDIALASSVQDVLIDGYSLVTSDVSKKIQVNVASAGNVVITGLPSNANIINQASDTIVIGGGKITVGGTAITVP
jgi:Pectate lyase superfamily protein